MVSLPNETKNKLKAVLSHAASKEKTVIEFTRQDGSLYAKDITEHVDSLEDSA